MKTSLLCALAMLFTACAAAPGETDGVDQPEQVATTDQALTETLVGNVDVYDEWEKGFCAKVDITNTGAAKTDSWTVTLDMNTTIYDGTRWNGGVSQNGSTLTITSDGNNATIAPGATLAADKRPGFCGTHSGYGIKPVFISGSGNYTPNSNGPTGCFETPMRCVLQGNTCVARAVSGYPLPPACNGKFTSYGTADCGATWYISTKGCAKTSLGSCTSYSNGGPGGIQQCQ